MNNKLSKSAVCLQIVYKSKRPAALLLMLAVTAALLSGCWDYSEIKDKTIVAGISLDLTDEGKIRAGFELLPLPAGNDETVEPAVLFAEGDTVEQAIFALTEKISYAPYISHSWLIAVSEEFASRGIEALVELICAHPAFYMGSYIAVVKGGEAGEILSCKSISAPILSFEVVGSFEADAQFVSKTNAMYTYKLFSGMDGEKQCFVLPAVEIKQPDEGGGDSEGSEGSGDSEGSGGSEGGEGGSPVVANAGGAVFANGKLEMFLSPDEVQAYRLFTGQVETAILTPDRADLVELGYLDERGAATSEDSYWAEELTYSIISASADMKVEMSGELPRYSLKVEIEATAKALPDTDMDGLCEELGRAKVLRMLGGVLELSREMKCDFLGLGRHLHMHNTAEYNRLSDEWRELYPQLSVDIEVSFSVNG